MTDILPADEERELNFKRSNYWPVKFLLPNGSVVDKLPVDASVQVDTHDTYVTKSVIPGFNIPEFDKIECQYPNPSMEVYAYFKDDAPLVALIVLYTDSTKQYIQSVEKMEAP